MFGNQPSGKKHTGGVESHSVPYRKRSEPLCEELQFGNVGCEWQTEPNHIINLHYPFGDSLHGATDHKGTYGKRSETIYRALPKGGYQNGSPLHIQKERRNLQGTIPKGNFTPPQRSVTKEHISHNRYFDKYHTENKRYRPLIGTNNPPIFCTATDWRVY